MKKLNPISPIFLWLVCLSGFRVQAQEAYYHEIHKEVYAQLKEHSYTLVDFVDVNMKKQGLGEDLCSMEFLEEWTIRPEEHMVLKQVLDHDSSCINLFKTLPVKKGHIHIRKISYEFQLLDPHLIASGNVSFSEPDSMDLYTRRLQMDLIALISDMSSAEKRYPLEDQLLSVIFYEDWLMDPHSGRITKKVWGIRPVIWQRRQTADGFPVNEEGTGMPVYYKNELGRLDLVKEGDR